MGGSRSWARGDNPVLAHHVQPLPCPGLEGASGTTQDTPVRGDWREMDGLWDTQVAGSRYHEKSR